MKDWVFGKHQDDGPDWPVDENGAGAPEAVAAEMSDSQLGADAAAGLLRSCGIPVLLRYPGDGVFGRLVLGASGYGVQLIVPEDRLEEAQALLAQDGSQAAEQEAELSTK